MSLQSSLRGGIGARILGLRCGADNFAPGGLMHAAFQVRWKKRKRKEKSVKTEEQKATKTSDVPIRLEDYIGSPEPPHSIAKNIKRGIARVCDGWKRKLDFRRYNQYRFRKVVGLTHDEAKPQGSAFVTPLTRLQHKASLPLTHSDSRFPFPHTLIYQCFWGPAQTVKETGQSECKVAVRLGELGLTERQRATLLEVLGAERHDKSRDMVCLEADHFENRNHNAAYLGDAFERLMTEVKKSD